MCVYMCMCVCVCVFVCVCVCVCVCERKCAIYTLCAYIMTRGLGKLQVGAASCSSCLSCSVENSFIFYMPQHYFLTQEWRGITCSAYAAFL